MMSSSQQALASQCNCVSLQIGCLPKITYIVRKRRGFTLDTPPLPIPLLQQKTLEERELKTAFNRISSFIPLEQNTFAGRKELSSLSSSRLAGGEELKTKLPFRQRFLLLNTFAGREC